MIIASAGSTVVVVLIFIGLCVVSYWYDRAQRRARIALNQKVFYKERYAAAKAQIDRTFTLRTAADPERAIAAIASGIGALPEKPGRGRTPGVSIEARSDSALLIEYGNRAETKFTVAVEAKANGDGTIVTHKVHQWVERNGVPMAGKRLAQLNADIEASLKPIQPTEQAVAP